ncbi:hypothetical protein LINGRAHAP2_LOCUS12210 [Linum grandiflorum]
MRLKLLSTLIDWFSNRAVRRRVGDRSRSGWHFARRPL